MSLQFFMLPLSKLIPNSNNALMCLTLVFVTTQYAIHKWHSISFVLKNSTIMSISSVNKVLFQRGLNYCRKWNTCILTIFMLDNNSISLTFQFLCAWLLWKWIKIKLTLLTNKKNCIWLSEICLPDHKCKTLFYTGVLFVCMCLRRDKDVFLHNTKSGIVLLQIPMKSIPEEWQPGYKHLYVSNTQLCSYSCIRSGMTD